MLGRLQAAVDRWLRRSLRRWLVLPVFAISLTLALLGGVSSRYLIDASFQELDSRLLLLAGELAVRSISQQLGAMGGLAGGLASDSRLAQALAANDMDAARTVLEMAAPRMAGQALAFVDSSTNAIGGPVSHGEQGLSLGTGAFFDPIVDELIRPFQGAEAGQLRIRLAVGGPRERPMLYAARPVQQEQRLVGVLLSALPLGTSLNASDMTAISGLVYHDLTGQPRWTAPGVSGVPATLLPVLAPHEMQTVGRVTTIVLGSRTYQYVALPLVVDGNLLGYLTTWQIPRANSAEVQRLKTFLLIILLLATLVVFALSIWVSGRVIRPVTALVSAARAMGEGQYDHHVPEDTVGELSLLARAFNSVLAQINRQTETLTEQARQSDYLFQAGSELGRTLDLDDSLQTAAEAIYGLGGLAYVVVMVGRGELGPYECRAVRGLAGPGVVRMMGRAYHVPLWGVMARALVGRQPLVIDNIVAEGRPRPDEFDWDIGRGSMLLFPICGANGPSGLIIVGVSVPGAFSAGYLGDLVFALARISSHGIQNAQLYQEALRSQEQLVTLQVISKLAASSKQLDNVLDVVVREAAEMLGDSQAWLFLGEAAGGGRQPYAQAHHAESAAWNSVHEDAVRWVLRAGQPIFYDPALPLAQSPILVHGGPAVCVPLEVDEETIGTLVVVRQTGRRVFAEDDMIVLRTLTNAAAVALHSAQLKQQFQSDYVELARAWAERADLRLWGTPGHAERVSTNSLTLAAAVGLSPGLHASLQIAAYLHDIAAEAVGEEQQMSPEPNTGGHAEVAASWLAAAGLDSRVVGLVRTHHLARPELNLGEPELGRAAAILALVNFVDCLLSGQGGRPPAAPAAVFEHLTLDDGRNFSPVLTSEYMQLWSLGRLSIPETKAVVA